MHASLHNEKRSFLFIYQFFENVMTKLRENDFDKYDFFFSYMQIGKMNTSNLQEYSSSYSNSNNFLNLREDTIINCLKMCKTENRQDYSEIIEKFIIPDLMLLKDKFYNSNQLDKDIMCEKLDEDLIRVKNIIEKSSISANMLFKNNMPQNRINILLGKDKKNENINIDNGLNPNDSLRKKYNSELVNNKELFENLKLWIKKFFNDKKSMLNFPYNEIQSKNQGKLSNLSQTSSNKSDYLNFRDVTNPSLPTIVMNNLISLNEKHLEKAYEVTNSIPIDKNTMDIDEPYINNLPVTKKAKTKGTKLDIVKIWKAWNECFAEIGSEFRLKIVFAEFLTKFESLDYEDKKKIEILQNFFLKICHEMYLLGYISRKKTKADIFIKNYYTLPRYRMKDGSKMDIV